jgi:hypothetical protein
MITSYFDANLVKGGMVVYQVKLLKNWPSTKDWPHACEI